MPPKVLVPYPGPELASTATQLFCLEAAVSSAAATDGFEPEDQAVVSRAVVDALLDGTSPALMAPFLRGLYQRVLARLVAADPASKVPAVPARSCCQDQG